MGLKVGGTNIPLPPPTPHKKSGGNMPLALGITSKFVVMNYTRKEGNVLFNDTLNTFYLRLYGVIHMVKDHSDCEGGNPLPPHGLLFPISSAGFFYMHHPTDRITHTSRGALAGTRNS